MTFMSDTGQGRTDSRLSCQVMMMETVIILEMTGAAFIERILLSDT